MNNTTTETVTPWYKQFWPWFLIFFPATAVVAGIITIVIAVKSDDGLVVDDYYKAGKAINQVLDLRQKAQSLQINADASWDQDTQTITVSLSGKLTPPARLKMHFVHATRSHRDKSVYIYLAPDKKSYTGRVNLSEKGNWNVLLETENKDWRITGRATLPTQLKWAMN